MKDKKRAKKSEPGGKPKRVPYRPTPSKTWKIKRLPQDLKEQLDALLSDGTFHSSRQLAKWLGDNGFEISHRRSTNTGRSSSGGSTRSGWRRNRRESFASNSRTMTQQMQSALLRLVQTRLFEVLDRRQRRRARDQAEPGSATVAP